MGFSSFRPLLLLALSISLHAAQFAPEPKGFRKGETEKALQEAAGTAFDVVSIRPSKPGGQLSFDLTGDGFTARSTPIFWVIMEAYYPAPLSNWRKDRLTGVPSWVSDDEFDISAKLSESQRNAFVHLSEPERESRNRLMLRTALRERLNLQISQGSSPASAWALTIGKHAPKITPSLLTAAAPSGIGISDGGVMKPLQLEDNRHGMQFYRTAMPAFAEVLAGLGTENDLPIIDHTGLTGRYDFILLKQDAPSSSSEQDAPVLATQWDVQQLGFRLKRETANLPSLVVSHVERPTAN